MKTIFKKFSVIAVAGAISLLAACKKDQSSGLDQNRTALSGNWKLTDMMQVNNDDGKPQAITDLSFLNNETLQLNDEDNYSGHHQSGDLLTIRNTNGENVLLNIIARKDDTLTLSQTYPGVNGMASGTIYYAFSKN